MVEVLSKVLKDLNRSTEVVQELHRFGGAYIGEMDTWNRSTIAIESSRNELFEKSMWYNSER